jgi:membrane protease subunit (stomatin/prohibitin family)
MSSSKQGTLFRGIYQFEDPSGVILVARMPAAGAADLYDGTKVIVRPNQVAILVYKGKYADFLTNGLKTLKTENIPVITRLANFKLGFQSPLLAEIWFFSLQQFVNRRWGTQAPAIATVDGRPLPLKAFGTYTMRVLNPRKLHGQLIGSRPVLSVTDAEAHIQSEILENLPDALKEISQFEEINTRQDEVSDVLQELVNVKLQEVGLEVANLQIVSIRAPEEVMKALNAKLAMDVVGDPNQYFMYNAAKSMGTGSGAGGEGQDPLQMMMTLMMSKGLMGNDFQANEKGAQSLGGGAQNNTSTAACNQCGHLNPRNSKFCSQCGGAM